MISTRHYGLAVQYSLYLVAVLIAVGIGWMITGLENGPSAAFLMPFIPLALLILIKPELGMLLAFPVFVLIPYDAINLPLPIFDSPLQLVLIATVGIASLQFAIRRKSILPTLVYYPIAICILLPVVSLASGRGPDTGLRLYRFLLSLWPFALVVLIVETPKQARRFLLSAVVPVALLVISWLPIMAWFSYTGQSPSGLLRTVYSPTFAEEYPILAFLQPGGVTRSWIILMVAPIFLGVGLLSQEPTRRRLARALYLFCAAYLFLSTFVASIGAFLFETVLVFVLVLWINRAQRSHYIYLTLLIIAVIVVSVLTGASDEIEHRLLVQLAPETVPGVTGSRLDIYKANLQLAFRHWLIGIGGYQFVHVTPEGERVFGHTFWLRAMYEFGVFYLLAWVAIVQIVLRRGWHLVQIVHQPEERGVLLGVLVGLVTIVLLSVVNSVLNSPGPDTYFWLFAGLILLWSHWRERDPQARLLA